MATKKKELEVLELTQDSNEQYEPIRAEAPEPIQAEAHESSEPKSDVPPQEEWTVRGQPIPIHLRHLIPYANTDQGLQDALDKRTTPLPVVEIVRSEWDALLQQREDQPWAPRDPLQEAQDKFGKPGFQYRGLSDRVCKKRGMRGWEIVKQANGDPVNINGMILGRMPIESARQRNKYYVREAETQFKNAEENLRIDQERIMRDSRSGGDFSPLRAGDVIQDPLNPDNATSIGVTSQRGL